jgi:hypothetical protein
MPAVWGIPAGHPADLTQGRAKPVNIHAANAAQSVERGVR